MTKKELEDICYQSCRTVEEVAGFIRKETGKVGEEKIEVKSLNSLVSYVDKTAEEILVSELGRLIPGSVFLTEEETVTAMEGELQWIIDPLDGTTNFLHQIPCFAVSVALRYRQKTVLGIVYEVNRSECYFAWLGGGAYLNGKAIRVSQTKQLSEALLATGFPYRDYDRMRSYFIAFEGFMKKTRGLRRLGAAAVDLAYVACGRFDAFFEYGLSPWDVAAGALLVQEAGGKVCDFRGSDNFLFGGEMIAASPGIFNSAFEIVNTSFSQ